MKNTKIFTRTKCIACVLRINTQNKNTFFKTFLKIDNFNVPNFLLFYSKQWVGLKVETIPEP